MYKVLKNFLHHQAAGGIFLLLATLMALVFANTGLESVYSRILNMPLQIGISINDVFYGLDKPLLLWVNDALMTLFFLVVGLEIKRELLIGELSSRSKALQPLFAAIGGVVVPILCFVAINRAEPVFLHGWAVPCATDIAFALGILALLGNRVPLAIKILLMATAIIDDLIAVIMIALFYTGDLHAVYLVGALIGAGMLVALNRAHVLRILPYMFAGALIWASFLKAGIHPTLAGVVTAIALPIREREDSIKRPPLLRLENDLHPWVVFIIVPLFAFMNAGLNIRHMTLEQLTRPLTLGVMLGLMLGKPLGIMAGLYAGHLSGLARKPAIYKWPDYFGISLLCGIGFTMSLFIGELAFHYHSHIELVKLGVLSASFFMAVLGLVYCHYNFKSKLQSIEEEVPYV